MKERIDQIKYIDTILLPIYGIKSIVDYNSKICYKMVDKKMMDKLNVEIENIKKVYPIKEFNLHKTDNKIKSNLQAIGILKKCLEISNVQYEIVTEDKINYIRLIEGNKILNNYIKMIKNSDIQENNIMDKIGKMECIELESDIEYSELESNIKSIEREEYYKLESIRDNSIITKLSDILVDTNNIQIYVDNKLNAEYKLFIGGSGDNIMVGKIEVGKNILNNKIIPFSMNLYTEVNLMIKSNELDKNVDLMIKIVIDKIIFNKKMKQRMNKKNSRVVIENDEYTELVISGGEIKKREKKDISICVNKYSEVEKKDIKGRTMVLNNYKCFEMDDILDFNEKEVNISDVFSILINKDIDIAIVKGINWHVRVYSCKIDKDHYILNYIIPHYADAIKLEELQILEKYVGEVRIVLESYNYGKELLLKEEYECDKIVENKYIIKMSNPIRCIIGKYNILKIIINKVNNLESIMRNIKIDAKYYFMDQKLRYSLDDKLMI